VWVEGSHKHEGLVQKFVNLVLVGHDTDDTIAGECIGSITQETNRPENKDEIKTISYFPLSKNKKADLSTLATIMGLKTLSSK
jgi:hypothetical protein